jgi:hypothetical protein
MKKRTVHALLLVLSTFQASFLAASLEKPDFGRHGLTGLSGFWRLYPFAGGKTLARYGNRVLLGFAVPQFVQTALAKNQLPAALKSTKRYVDSGGTWDKTRGQQTP